MRLPYLKVTQHQGLVTTRDRQAQGVFTCAKAIAHYWHPL